MVSWLWLLLVVTCALAIAAVRGEEECDPPCRQPDQVCESAVCQPATCFDREWTEGETDVDCGGPFCLRRCGEAQQCERNEDCQAPDGDGSGAGKCSMQTFKCLANECFDGMLNGNETAVDCGGEQCDACPSGEDCQVNEDCQSNECETLDRFICSSPHCRDESQQQVCGIDPNCARCDAGQACEHDAQCKSEYCEAGKCRLANCESCGLEENCPLCSAGEACETDAQCASNKCSSRTGRCLAENCHERCGGGLCDACGLGLPCDGDEDCDAELGLKCDEEDAVCAPLHCYNGKRDADETDVDCGGQFCSARCPNAHECNTDADCTKQAVCDLDKKRCMRESCTNQVQDADESGLDCGGPHCLPCQRIGSGCTSNADVDFELDLVCDAASASAVRSHCLDGQVNADETDVDCGGPSCAKRCAQGLFCQADTDCASNDCYEGVCVPASCHNKKWDANESDLDCGGKACRACSVGAHCGSDQDCESGMCSEFHFKCQPPECATRCGGPCDPCPDTSSCSSDSDCASQFCFGDNENLQADQSGGMQFIYPEAARGVCIPASCREGCGKGDCPGCAAGAPCTYNSECASGSCDKDNARCFASTCFDGKLGEEETDVDCGGGQCPKCLQDFATCRENGDCITGLCGVAGKCLPATCGNKRLDGKETAVDCGGGDCNPCRTEGAQCELSARDCSSEHDLLCSPAAGVCVDKHCLNGIREPNREADIDCGPDCFRLCGIGAQCELDNECSSGFCYENRCAPEHCAAECGQAEGDCPNKCRAGEECEEDAQCEANARCLDSRCVNERACAENWKQLGATDPSGCGGPLCARCGAHRRCQSKSDCTEGFLCNANKCEFETCFDGALGLGEVCIDGGGVCKRRCGAGGHCRSDFDCERTLSCDALGGVCTNELPRKKPLSPPTTRAAGLALSLPPPSAVELFFTKLDVSPSLQAELLLFEQEMHAFQPARAGLAEMESLQWSTRVLPLRSLDALCNPVATECVLEELDSAAAEAGNPPLLAHVYYSITASAVVFTTWSHFEGFFLHPGVNASFTNGLQVAALSVVGMQSALTLRGACDFQQGGLVVEFGALLTVLPNTTLSGRELLGFGEIILHAGAHLNFDKTQFFGKVTVLPGPAMATTFAQHVDLAGTLVLQGSAHMRSAKIHGLLALVSANATAHFSAGMEVEGGLVYVGEHALLALRGGGANIRANSLVYSPGQMTIATATALFAQGKFVGQVSISAALSSLRVSNEFALAVFTGLTLDFATHAVFAAARTHLLAVPNMHAWAKLWILHDVVLHSASSQVTFGGQVVLAGRLVLPPSTTTTVRFASHTLLLCGNTCLSFSEGGSTGRLSIEFHKAVIVTKPWRVPALWSVEFIGPVWFANALDNSGTLHFHGSTALALVSHTYTGKGHVILNNRAHMHVLGDAEFAASVGGSGATLSVGVPSLRDLSRLLFNGTSSSTLACGKKQSIVLVLTNALYLHVDFCITTTSSGVWNQAALLARLNLTATASPLVLSKTRFGSRLGALESLPDTVFATPTAEELEAFLQLPASFYLDKHVHGGGGGSLIELSGSHMSFTAQRIVVHEHGKLIVGRGSRTIFTHNARMETHRGARLELEPKSQLSFQGRSTLQATASNITVEVGANLTLAQSSMHIAHGSFENFGLVSFARMSNVSLAPQTFTNAGDMHAQSDSTLSLTSAASHSSTSQFHFLADSIFDVLGYLYLGPNTQTSFFNNSLFQASGDVVAEGTLSFHTRFAYFDGQVDMSGKMLVQGAGSMVRANVGSFFTLRGLLQVGNGAGFIFEGSEFKLVPPEGKVECAELARCVFAGDRLENVGASMRGALMLQSQTTKLGASAHVALTHASELSGRSFSLLDSAVLVIAAPVMEQAGQFTTEIGSTVQITRDGALHLMSGEVDFGGAFNNEDGGLLIVANPSALHWSKEAKKRRGSVVVKSRNLESTDCSARVVQVNAGAVLTLRGAAAPVVCEHNTEPIEVKSGGTLAVDSASNVRMHRGILLHRGARLIVSEGSALALMQGAQVQGNGRISILERSTLFGNGGAMLSADSLEFANKSTLVVDGTFNLDVTSMAFRSESRMDISSKKTSLTISPNTEWRFTEQSKLESFGRIVNAGVLVLEQGARAILYGGTLVGETGRLHLFTDSKLQVQGTGFALEQRKLELGENTALSIKSCEQCLVSAHERLSLVSARLLVEGHRTSVRLTGATLAINSRSKVLINTAGGSAVLDFKQQQSGIDCFGQITIVNHDATLVIAGGELQLRRHGRLLVEAGAVKLSPVSARFNTQSSVKVFPFARLEANGGQVYFDAESHFVCQGECRLWPKLFKADNELVAEGKLILQQGISGNNGGRDALFSLAKLLIQPSGTAEFKSSEEEEEEGALFTVAALHSLGYLAVREHSVLAVSQTLRSSGDVLLDRFSKLLVLKAGTLEKSFSTVRLDGASELIVERGALLKLFTTIKSHTATQAAVAKITVRGTLESHGADIHLLGVLNVTSSGTFSGSATLRNCSMSVSGRLDFATNNALGGGGGVLSIENADFDLLPNAVFEANVFLQASSITSDRVTSDLIDVKQGSVRLGPKSILSLAVMMTGEATAAGGGGREMGRIDVAPITADLGKLVWHKGSLRVAAFSLAKSTTTTHSFSSHAFEVDDRTSSALHVRLERAEKSAVGRSLLGSLETNVLIPTYHKKRQQGVAALAVGWEKIVQTYLGGGTPVLDQDESIISVPCFEQAECRAFCALFGFTKPLLIKELGLADLSTRICATTTTAHVLPWTDRLPACHTNGKRGTARKGELCDFPFDHLGVTYTSCAKDLVQGDWCLTESGNWGDCTCDDSLLTATTTSKRQSAECWTNGLGPASADQPCVFPFFEHRDAYEAHFACVGSGLGGSGFCRTLTGEVGGCECRRTTNKKPIASEVCITNGRGNAPAGRPCVFPFTWRNHTYSACVGSGWGSGQGFCITKQSQRGGCVCEDSVTSVTPKEEEGHEEDVLYFMHGPSAHARSEDMIEVFATLNVPHAKWYVFAQPHGEEAPNNLAGSLKQATAYSFTTSAMLRGLDWKQSRGVYDLYFYAQGFDREDVLANALLGVHLKPPPLDIAPHLVVSPQSLSLQEGESASVELMYDDDDSNAVGEVHIVVELSQAHHQLRVSPSDFLLKQKGQVIEMEALEDGISEAQHSVLVHFIDKERVVTVATVEVFITDSSMTMSTKIRQGMVFSLPPGASDLDGILALGARDARTYSIHLSAPPNSAVLVELEDVKNALQVSSPLVFGKLDWDEPKRIHLHSSTREALIRHRVSSSDARFQDVDRFVRVPADLISSTTPGSMSHNKPPLKQQQLQDVYIFPQSTTEHVLYEMSKETLACSDDRIDLHPKRLSEFDHSPITLWVDKDPGYSFSAELVIGKTGRVLAKLHYVSRIPAIVLSKERLLAATNEHEQQALEYFISLSLPISAPVLVAISTETDSVCMDLHAEFKRPCTNKNCLKCVTNQPEVVITPNLVRFQPSTSTGGYTPPVRIQIEGYANESSIYYQRLPATQLLITHRIVSGSTDAKYGADTPTVFGPFDTMVHGLELVMPAHIDNTVKPALAVRATKKRYEFIASLNYLSRAKVEITEPNCGGTLLVMDAGVMEAKFRCSAELDLLALVTHSEDALFDNLRVEFAPPLSIANRMGRLLSLGLNLVAMLCTLVAVLLVWIQLGPHTFPATNDKQQAFLSRAFGSGGAEQQELEAMFLERASDLHEFDLVIVECEDEEGKRYYRKGRVFGDEDVFTRSWAVAYLDLAGGVDFEMDSQRLCKYPRSSNVEEEVMVLLEVSSAGDDFGIRLAWTSKERAIIAGLVPLSAAFLHPDIALGDGIAEVNGKRNWSSLEEVQHDMRQRVGNKLQIKLQKRADL